MATPDLIAEAIANVTRLNGGPVFDLSADVNVGATLALVQKSTANYAALIAEGKGWGGNPESTMTAAYAHERPRSPPKAGGLPLPGEDGVLGLAPPTGGEVVATPSSSVGALPGSPTPEALANQASASAALEQDAEEWVEGEEWVED